MIELENQNDSQLARKAAGGDHDAFVSLVKRHQGMVSGVTLSILKDFAASEDAAQETFITAWKKLSSLHDPSKVRPWLGTLARNAALSHLRMKKRKGEVPSFDEEVNDAALRPDEVSVQKDDLSFVMGVLESLPEKFRTPLILFYREDQSVSAVAEALGLSQDAVKQRLKRGRDALRDQVEATLATTLIRSAPAAAFTASVVTALAAFAPASATAAAGLSISSVTSPTAAASTTVAMVNSSKLSLTAAALLGVVAIPAGYGVRSLFTQEDTRPPLFQSTTATVQNQSMVPRESIMIPPSQIADEWKRLKETYGTTASSFLPIAAEIKQRPNGFVKSALVATLAAEWARVDGQGGFAYSQGRGRIYTFERIFAEEWMKLDPLAVIAAYKTTQSGLDSGSLALPAFARYWPDVMMAHLGEFSFENGMNYDKKERALRLLAESDPIALRDASLKLEGRAQDAVLGAALSEWALRDAKGALDWTLQNLEKGSKAQLEGIYSTLKGLAEVDPVGALDQLQDTMTKITFKDSYEGQLSVLASGLLATMAEEDFEGAIAWWGNHPKVVTKGNTGSGFNEFILDRLSQKPAEVLDSLAANGLMDVAGGIFSRSHTNQDYTAKWREISEALVRQPYSASKQQLLSRLAISLARSNPDHAVELVELVGDTDILKGPNDRSVKSDVIRQLLAPGTLKNAEELVRRYPDWKDDIQAGALARFVGKKSSSQSLRNMNLQPWLKISEGLESKAFNEVFGPLSAKYMEQDPERALQWMESQSDDRFTEHYSKASAMFSAFHQWAAQSNRDALEWVQKTNLEAYPEETRRAMAKGLMMMSPDLAPLWPLFHSISSPKDRQEIVELLTIDSVMPIKDIIRELNAQPIPAAEKAEYEKILRGNSRFRTR